MNRNARNRKRKRNAKLRLRHGLSPPLPSSKIPVLSCKMRQSENPTGNAIYDIITKFCTFFRAGRPRVAPMPRSAYGDGYLRSEGPKSLKNSVQSGCKTAGSVANARAMVWGINGTIILTFCRRSFLPRKATVTSKIDTCIDTCDHEPRLRRYLHRYLRPRTPTP